MTHSFDRPSVSLIRTLFLWGARWTAGLALIGIVTSGREDVSWIWTAGIGLALADLFVILLKEARLADKRARSRDLARKLEQRLSDGIVTGKD